MSANGPPPSWVSSEIATAKRICSMTTTHGLNRTAAQTSTGRGAKPSVRCPGASVSRVAVARVRPCATSSTRRCVQARLQDLWLSMARGASSITEAPWEGTTRPRVVRKEEPSIIAAYVSETSTPPTTAPTVAITNNRQTSLTSRRRPPRKRTTSQPTRATSTESASPSRMETSIARPAVTFASAKATVRATSVTVQRGRGASRSAMTPTPTAGNHAAVAPVSWPMRSATAPAT